MTETAPQASQRAPVWGVLLVDGADPAQARERLAAMVSGVVTVGENPCADLSMAGTVLERLAAAMPLVPDEAEAVAVADAGSLADPSVLVEMLGALRDTDDAVVRVQPVTDALKRIRDDLVVDDVDRTGLLTPVLPQVLRRSALARALPGPGGVGDPAGLLGLGGGTVRMAAA